MLIHFGAHFGLYEFSYNVEKINDMIRCLSLHFNKFVLIFSKIGDSHALSENDNSQRRINEVYYVC